jgi:hypothetical protein
MRWLPRAIPLLIAVIALDLALVFGFEAFRVLTSPVNGLDAPVFAGLVFGIGRVLGIAGQGLSNVAGFFGGFYLTIAVVFTLYLASRIGALRGGRVSHDLLDAGMILVVLVTMVAATPAILAGATDILVQERLPLWLVGLAATLSMIERLPETDPETIRPNFAERLWMRFAARRTRDESTLVSPAVRGKMPAIRWDDLRSAGGMIAVPMPVVRALGPQRPLRPR